MVSNLCDPVPDYFLMRLEKHAHHQLNKPITSAIAQSRCNARENSTQRLKEHNNHHSNWKESKITNLYSTRTLKDHNDHRSDQKDSPPRHQRPSLPPNHTKLFILNNQKCQHTTTSSNPHRYRSTTVIVHNNQSR
jgi:hypothetical protein